MTNPLIEQVRKPLTERGWHQSEESFNEGDYLNATLGDVESLFEARCIQALEDQPALIAEIERLEQENADMRERLTPPSAEEQERMLEEAQDQRNEDDHELASHVGREAYECGFAEAESKYRED